MRLRLLGLVVLLVLALGGGAVFLLQPTSALRQGPIVVEIPPHVGVFGVAQRLRDAGAVRSAWGFVGAAGVRGEVRRLKAGEYEFPRDASTFTVVHMMASGRVRRHPVLHPEGATVSELARALEAARLARVDDVLRVAGDRAFLAAHGIDGPSVEGYLFPDTYHFVRGMTAEEILGRMVQRMRTKLTADILERAKARGMTAHELLTLASIVEREAAVADEQKLIAAVFVNRLKLDMPLQADPTVQYALGKERKALTRSDLMTEHPFNTYRNAGLPPGPIASPGAGAIEAVLDPAPVKYLYFVAVSADGRRHQFSTTVEEHNAAVARYRLSRSQPRRRARTGAPTTPTAPSGTSPRKGRAGGAGARTAVTRRRLGLRDLARRFRDQGASSRASMAPPLLSHPVGGVRHPQGRTAIMRIRTLIGIAATTLAMTAVTAYAQTSSGVVTSPPSTVPAPAATPPGLAQPPTGSQPRGLPPNPDDRYRVPPAGSTTRSTPPNPEDRFRVPPQPRDLGTPGVTDPSASPSTVPSTGLSNPAQPGTVPSTGLSNPGQPVTTPSTGLSNPMQPRTVPSLR